MFRKGKIDVEGKNSGYYSLFPTTLNKEIPPVFNLTTPKEDLVHISYGCIIFKT